MLGSDRRGRSVNARSRAAFTRTCSMPHGFGGWSFYAPEQWEFVISLSLSWQREPGLCAFGRCISPVPVFPALPDASSPLRRSFVSAQVHLWDFTVSFSWKYGVWTGPLVKPGLCLPISHYNLSEKYFACKYLQANHVTCKYLLKLIKKI